MCVCKVNACVLVTCTVSTQHIYVGSSISDMTPCYETVIPLFMHFSGPLSCNIRAHSHEHFSFFHSLRIKIRVYSGQSRKGKQATTAERVFMCGFSFTSMAFDGSTKCLLTHFLFFSLWWIACESIVVGWWRVWCTCSRILVSKIGNQGILFHHFRIRFEFFSFLLQFIIIFVINLHCVYSHLVRFPVFFFSHAVVVAAALISFIIVTFSLSFLCLHNFSDSSIEIIIFVWNFCLFLSAYSLYHFGVNLIQRKQKQCSYMLFKWN